MKSILNKGIHELLKLAHRSVKVSETKRQEYLSKAEEVASQISEWIGNDERECIGLGQNCNASWYLKESGNKRASYPFDWMFTTPNIMLDILGDDFGSFLDQTQLIPHGLDAGHQRYHETLFGHRNPATSADDHAFFKRCVERWNQLMYAQKPVVFLTVVLNESDKRKRWKEGFTKEFNMPTNQKLADFEKMIKTILTINPNCKFLFIEQYTEMPFELSVIEKNSQSLWIRFNAIDSNTGVQYLNEVDDEVIKTVLKGLQP